MRISRSLPAALAVAMLCSSFVAPPATAAEGPIKIAVITNMSGVYAALAGPGAVEATKMAVEDFGGKVLGRTVEVVGIDHRNNGPDAAIKAREAYDSGAELALDMTNSSVALAVAAVAKEKKKLAIVTGGASRIGIETARALDSAPGVELPGLQRTPEGWEMTFATNHLGHFALALGLHDALAAVGDARIVSVSSVGHRRSPVIFDDVAFTSRAYDVGLAYGQSKTANVLFAVEATRRTEP